MTPYDIRQRAVRHHKDQTLAALLMTFADVVEVVGQSLHSGTFNAWNAEVIRQVLARVEALKP